MSVIEQERQAVITRTTNPVADILDRAADLIERDGWFQCCPSHREGSYPRCAIVALRDSWAESSRSFSALDVCAALQEFSGPDIVGWNNTPGRTKAEVVSALRCASVAASR